MHPDGELAQHDERRTELANVAHAVGDDRRVADVWPGADSGAPSVGAVLDGSPYFTANDGVHGRELWTYDPTCER